MDFINIAHAAEESAGLSLQLNPYILGYLGEFPITSTLLTAWLAIVFLIVMALIVKRKISLVPNKLQSVMEMLIGGAYDYTKEILGTKEHANRYFPIIITIFIFVLAVNWIGVLPGVGAFGFYDDTGHLTPLLYPSATDLNITIGLTIVAFFTIEIAGILSLGLWKYGSKFINFKSPLSFAIGIMELISVLARLVSFSFRLFGNIFAGKTLILIAIFFAPYIVPMPIYAYEIFVGIIQAGIFAVLTLFFIKLAHEAPH